MYIILVCKWQCLYPQDCILIWIYRMQINYITLHYSVCSLKSKPYLFWDIIPWRFCEMFYNTQGFHSLCPAWTHPTLWAAPKLSIQCCLYGGICWKGNPLFLLFVRLKAIVTFQHSFYYSHMLNRTTRTKYNHPGMSLFCLVHP